MIEINNCKSINNILKNKLKYINKKYSKGNGIKIKESKELYDDLTENNLGNLDIYICKNYYEYKNFDIDNQ